jgi:hypothetical protein
MSLPVEKRVSIPTDAAAGPDQRAAWDSAALEGSFSYSDGAAGF